MAKPSQQNHGSGANNVGLSATTTMKAKRTRKTVPRDSPPQRSSIYRGVTRHRWTGRYEAHLWDKNCWNESQNKKGRQVYLGAYHDEEAAAHAYDLAALKYWGPETILNFPLSTYERELKEMEGLSREEYIGSLRRRSSGFSRGVSKYRGVARHHHNGRWEARIGRVFGNKYLYLGTYATQEEAATAYDMAAIEYRGLNAVTNFDLSRYIKWLKPNQNNPVDVLQPNSPKIGSNNFPPNPSQDQFGISFLNLPPTSSSSSSSSSCSSSTAAAAASCEPPLTPTTMTQARPPMASSALGLLLQSSKFKEMMEMTAAADEDGLSSFSTTPAEPDLPRCSFPEDIQTYFECQLDSGSYEEGDDVIFSELSSFIPPMFQCDFSG